jgi:hypothetical protein
MDQFNIQIGVLQNLECFGRGMVLYIHCIFCVVVAVGWLFGFG